MNHFNKLFIIALLAGLAMSGCKDPLNQYPTDQPTTETFYTTEDDLNLAINGVYNRTLYFKQSGYPAPAFWDAATDLTFWREGNVTRPLVSGNADSQTGIFNSTWSHLYGGISQANGLLENMSRAEGNVDPEIMNRIEAEARFLRAFSYHYLTELYGDVPLLTTVPTPEEALVNRTPKSEVVSQIIEDLDFAAQNLPAEWTGSNAGRITSGAAKALKARVALYNEDYGTAAQTAQEVMSSGNYSLHPDYREQFQYEGERSAGVILDTDYERGTEDVLLGRRLGPRKMFLAHSTIVPSQQIVDSYEATDGEPIDESSVYDPSNPFENRDPRLDDSIVRSGAVWDNFIYQTHPDSSETWIVDENGNRIERTPNPESTNPFASFTGYLWRKYLDPEDRNNRGESSMNFIYIRYAEMLLTYAEAKIEVGDIDQSVIDAINRVRARAYGVDLSQTSQYPAITTINQSELRTIVRRERKVEFANEGLRLFDIRRWGIASEVVPGTLMGRPTNSYSTVNQAPEINEYGDPVYNATKDLYDQPEERVFQTPRDLLWAIPQSELDLNDNMSQNPGY